MATLSSHVLDTTNGKPAEQVKIVLEKKTENSWQTLLSVFTNKDGRIDDKNFINQNFENGTYQLTFHIGEYFNTSPSFLNEVPIQFSITKDEHYHIPLVCSEYSYSTYRGS